jgi:putative redox protein
MVSFTLTYRGELRCEITHGPSQAHLITDAPVDNHGKGESFSPTDLLASGLGVCMATVMGIVAKREGVALDGLTATVEKHMTAKPPRSISRIVVRFSMPGTIPAAARAVLEQAARGCPVALSLHPQVVQEILFSYGAQP